MANIPRNINKFMQDAKGYFNKRINENSPLGDFGITVDQAMNFLKVKYSATNLEINLIKYGVSENSTFADIYSLIY